MADNTVTDYLSGVGREEYDSNVKQAYQAEGDMLVRSVMFKPYKGKKVYFRRTNNKKRMQERTGSSFQPVTNDGLLHSLIPCPIRKFHLTTFSDEMDRETVDFDEIPLIGEAHGKAARRMRDQVILDALAQALTDGIIPAANIISVDFGGTGSNLLLDKTSELRRIMNKTSIPMNDRALVVGSSQESFYREQTKVASVDFNDQKPLAGGGLMMSHNGFGFYVVPDMDEGGLPIDANNVRTCYSYSKGAVGFTSVMEPTVKAGDNLNVLAYQYSTIMMCSAVVIDPAGVFVIYCDEDDTV